MPRASPTSRPSRTWPVAYGHAIDDGDWERWKTLFAPEARFDYTASGGIAGGLDEVAEWMPSALSVFTWSLHSILTHEIRFTGPDTATGRVHLFNRNGVEWEGEPELIDVGGLYLDEYVRRGEHWRFSARTEHTLYVTGGRFAAVVRDMAEKAAGRPITG
ncbi:MAG: nuclear transport factor 2 family protein [Acidimicrobiia bacterium]|nr:nuclear transport factor 2 family protein [Acidimicrobiia bacterium]